MAIAPLPQATVYLLGSAQALTTPTSLVKELVDNALDAKALSIDIIISQNTIDKVEVRDNGHGIQQEDLDVLGKRGHTSKLRSFDELKSIGGVSLGFRGEALASAVQLGDVTITTRTEGEPVATVVKLKAPGGIESRSRASHPIGTTVSVTKFMYKLPVRKQTFLKEAPKTLGRIKDLLQAYVLARPNIKFSLKVLKEKKTSWSYAPRPKDGVKEAVSQLFGKDVASQCISKSIRFPERVLEVDTIQVHGIDQSNVEASAELQSNEFIVDVFLPRPDADLSKVGHGQHISVDSRPVSHEKNTMRRIVTIFKYYLKESISDSSEKTKNPFLRLNITCPSGSYDPNIEPAKNDVIFGSESVVLEAIENLFKDVYGEPKAAATVSPTELLNKKLDNFELLLARKPATDSLVESPSLPTTDSVQGPPLEAAIPRSPNKPPSADDILEIEGGFTTDHKTAEELVPRSHRKWNVDMSKDLGEEVEGFERPSRRFQQQLSTQSSTSDAESSTGNSLNPWVIAKMTAPLQQVAQFSHTSRASYPASQPSAADFLPTPQLSSDPLPSHPNIDLTDGPNRPRHTFRNEDLRSPDIQTLQTPQYQSPSLGTIHRSTLHPSARPLSAGEDDLLLLDGDESAARRPRNDFVSARNLPDAALLSPPATLSPRKPRGVNRHFVPPTRRKKENDPSSDFDGFRQTKLTLDHGAPRPNTHMSPDMSAPRQNLDLEWSMDFEHRKEIATKRRRAELSASALAADNSEDRELVRTSPHKNRYHAAIAALEAGHSASSTITNMKEPMKTSLPDGDPRAYLMRRQKSAMAQSTKSGEAPKMARAKSTRLPLESIPENDKTFNLVLGLSADMDNLRNITKELIKSDMYVRNGNGFCSLMIGSLEATRLASRVQTFVGGWMEGNGKENCEIEYMFENLVTNC